MLGLGALGTGDSADVGQVVICLLEEFYLLVQEVFSKKLQR